MLVRGSLRGRVSSRRPSQRQIFSQRLSVLLPLIVLPLELSPKLTEFGAALSEFSFSKQYSRNSIPPVS